MPNEAMSAEVLRKLLTYNEDTGVFYWNDSPANSVAAGKAAGSIDQRGYVIIKILGVRHYAHRLVVLYKTGEWPTKKMWHPEGFSKTDNSWATVSKMLKTAQG